MCLAHRVHVRLCVELHGRPEILVTQHPLHRLRIHSQFDQRRRLCMAEVVKAETHLITRVTRRSVRGSAISSLSPSLQMKPTDDYAAVGNIEPDTSRRFHLKTAGAHLRSTVLALTRNATPAFKHTIDVVANCVSGIHAAKSLH